jgi:hypothetical protein
MKTNQLSRRSLLSLTSGLLLPACGLSCSSYDRKNEGFITKLNKDVHWLRRQEWQGLEMVKGIAKIEDRYLMVKRADSIQWDFPGGLIKPQIHGSKERRNMDLVRAVTDFVHSQAMIQILADTAHLAAYGYGLDRYNDRTYLVHWLVVGVPSSLLPVPHANLKETLDAKWVGLDDPLLKHCLAKRMDEYKKANEGSMIIFEPCSD